MKHASHKMAYCR